MNARGLLLASLMLEVSIARAQNLHFPQTIIAGSPFSVSTGGSGAALLYIVGPAQVLRRDVTLGEPISFAAGDLYRAGHYLAVVVQGSSTETDELDVQPALEAESLGFLAKPSRLPVNVHNGISGAVYVFDRYHNLILSPMPVTLELASTSSPTLTKTVTTQNGLGWATLDSAAKEGAARFTARAGGVSSTRIVNQVPGEPCSISIAAKPVGGRLEVQTAPVHDCSGNPIPDGTVVTFTESAGISQSTVDVPVKQGIASVAMPAIRGAKISAASGVVAGNEIRWDGAR